MHQLMYINYCISSMCLFVYFSATNGENILIWAEYGGGSHFLAATKIGKSLVSKGHNVTLFVSDAFEFRTRDPSLAEHFNFELYEQAISHDEMYEFFGRFGSLASYGQLKQMFELMRITQDVNINDCDAILSNIVTMERLRNARYTAILFDIVWPCGRLAAAMLGDGTRTVGMFQTIATSLLYHSAGIPLQPAYVPEFVSGFPQRMNFLQRVQNAVLTFMTCWGILSIPTEPLRYDALKLKHGIRQNVSMGGLLAETDLWLINVDNAIDFPVLGAANVIQVGGLTTGPANQLDQDLEDFVQSSGPHGVVVFSLGTYLTAIDPDIVRLFIEVLSELDQKVVFHIQDDMRESLNVKFSENIKTMPFLPQNDLLGHIKTRLLVFHGGNNGLHEAVYHGVPMVVVPIYADQYDVGTRVVERGLGLKLDKFELDNEIVGSAIREVLSTNKYKEAALRVSSIFRDRPQRPADRAAFWVEHVIKHGGGYMRSAAHDLNFFQLYLLDVIFFLILIGGISVFVAYRVLRAFVFSVYYMRHYLSPKQKTQ